MTQTIERLQAEEVMDVLSARDFTRDYVERIIDRAAAVDEMSQTLEGQRALARTWQEGIVAVEMYQRSTRTFGSFMSAAHRVGARAIGNSDVGASGKPELIEDAAIMYGSQAHVVVIRHSEDDAVERAAASIGRNFKGIFRPVVINAGSGERDHPTQALIDAYAIHKERDGQQADLHTVILGGFDNRTVRSYVQSRRLFPDNIITFLDPSDQPESAVPQDILEYMDEQGMPYVITDDIRRALGEADVLYVGRNKAKGDTSQSEKPPIVIGQEEVGMMRRDARILHALPRAGELDPSIDHLPQAAYMRQAIGGPVVRAAILLYIHENRQRMFSQ